MWLSSKKRLVTVDVQREKGLDKGICALCNRRTTSHLFSEVWYYLFFLMKMRFDNIKKYHKKHTLRSRQHLSFLCGLRGNGIYSPCSYFRWCQMREIGRFHFLLKSSFELLHRPNSLHILFDTLERTGKRQKTKWQSWFTSIVLV